MEISMIEMNVYWYILFLLLTAELISLIFNLIKMAQEKKHGSHLSNIAM